MLVSRSKEGYCDIPVITLVSFLVLCSLMQIAKSFLQLRSASVFILLLCYQLVQLLWVTKSSCLAFTVTRGTLVHCHVQQKILWPSTMYIFSPSVLLTSLQCIKSESTKPKFSFWWRVFQQLVLRDQNEIQRNLFISSFLSATAFHSNSEGFDDHFFLWAALLLEIWVCL